MIKGALITRTMLATVALLALVGHQPRAAAPHTPMRAQFMSPAFPRRLAVIAERLAVIASERSPARPNGLSTVDVNLQDANPLFYPNFSQLDIRFDKAIRFGGSRSLTLAATVYNVFNSNTTLEIVTRQNTSTANNITTILAPRVAQVGAKVTF
jgi:hypothetical protein